MNLFKSDEQKSSFINTYKNPFQSDKVTLITFDIRNDYWTNYKTKYRADIKFVNGKTEGKHSVEEKDFPTLVNSVEQFIKSL